MKTILTFTLLLFTLPVLAQELVEGQLLFQENNETYPLEGVNIYWLNTSKGTVSDQEGKFALARETTTNQLILQYLGFSTDTLTVVAGKKIIHFMKEDTGESLDEVELTQRRKAIQKSYFEAQNVMQVSSAELLKAACCNLSESFETNPLH